MFLFSGDDIVDENFSWPEKMELEEMKTAISNMKDNDNIMRYNMEHNIKTSINVFTYLNFVGQPEQLIEINSCLSKRF